MEDGEKHGRLREEINDESKRQECAGQNDSTKEMDISKMLVGCIFVLFIWVWSSEKLSLISLVRYLIFYIAVTTSPY